MASIVVLAGTPLIVGGNVSLKVAVMVVFPVMVKAHVVVALTHPPLKRLKPEPDAGVAVKVTKVPY